MYPFTNDIGKMKVSAILPTLGIVANEYNLDFAILPVRPERKNIHLVIWRGNNMKIAERIVRNNQRNN